MNSKVGTQFRQWATKRLKESLTDGYALNEKRLVQKNKEIQILQDGIKILSRIIEEKVSDNKNYIWLNYFSRGFQLLDDYDKKSLDKNGKHFCNTIYPSKNDYFKLILQMKSEILGRLKDGGFESAINQIQQGLGSSDIYPTIEEKAAILLYLIVKNHAFVNGNKRIAAACFFIVFESKSVAIFNPKKVGDK